jgi:acyl-CoA synthetase (AMP-forming)/AMP-acid ligase II
MRNYDTLTAALNSYAEQITQGIYFIKSREEEHFVPYGWLYQKALFVLHNLQHRGMRAGDELLFQIKDDNSEEYLYTFYACILGKIIPVPVSVSNNENSLKVFNVWKKLTNPRLITDESILAKLAQFSEAYGLADLFVEISRKVILIPEAMTEKAKGRIESCTPDDIAFIQFSSGSTGDPKGVVLTHGNLISNLEDIAERLEITGEDSMFNWMPLTHDMGLILFHLTPMLSGIRQYHLPTSLFIRNPVLWIDKLNQHQITITAAPNFGLQLLLNILKRKEYEWDLSCIRRVLTGAEPISVDVIAEFNAKMARYGLPNSSMCPAYGLAEACVAVTIPCADASWEYVYVDRDSLGMNQPVILLAETEKHRTGVKLAVEGSSLRRCEVRITADSGEVLGEGVVGHIQISGPNVTKG